MDDALPCGKTRGLLQLLRVSALRDVLEETQFPEVPCDGLRRPQAVPALVALGRGLRHLHLQIAFVLQVHDELRERRECKRQRQQGDRVICSDFFFSLSQERAAPNS